MSIHFELCPISAVTKQLKWKNSKSIASLSALSETHQMLQKTCRDFADKELISTAAVTDKEHKFPKSQIAKMGELGLMSVSVPEEYGLFSCIQSKNVF